MLGGIRRPACNWGGVAFWLVAHAGVSVRLLLR